MADDSLTIDSVETPSAGAPSAGRSSSSTSTTSKTINPAALSDYLRSAVEFAGAGGDVDNAIVAVTEAAAQRKVFEANQVAAIQDYATKAGQAAALDSAVNVSRAARREQRMAQAGLDPLVIENELSKAFSLMHSTAAVMEPLGQEIDSRMAVGIYDNPLEFLINQVRLPGMIGQYNALAGQTNRVVERIKTAQALLTTDQSLTDAVDSDKIQAAGLAKAAATASAATAKLSEEQIKSQVAAAMDQAAMLNMAGTAVQIKLATAKLQAESVTTREGMSDAATARASRQAEVDRINNALLRIGSNTQYDVPTYFSLSATERTKLQQLGGKEVVSENMADSLAFIDKYSSLQNIRTSGKAGVANWLSTFKNTAAANEESLTTELSKSGKIPSKAEIIAIAQNNLQQTYIRQTTDMRTASERNPLVLDYPSLAKNPELADNPISKYIVEFGPKSPNKIFNRLDEVILFDKFKADVIAGRLTTQQVGAIYQDFYSKAVPAHAMAVQYQNFGFPYVSEYRAVLTPLTNPFGGAGPIGYYDENLINKKGPKFGAEGVNHADGNAVSAAMVRVVAAELQGMTFRRSDLTPKNTEE
jgi:hypothetical protein